VALLKSGTINAFGNNDGGQCNVPADVQGQCVGVAAGASHTVALLKDGTINAFGGNGDGQCDVPADVQGQCVGVAPGGRHTVALLKDGTINAFGRNDDGQCNVPADVQGQCVQSEKDIVITVCEVETAVVAINMAGSVVAEFPFSQDGDLASLRAVVQNKYELVSRCGTWHAVKLVSRTGTSLTSAFDAVALRQGFEGAVAALETQQQEDLRESAAAGI